MHFTRAFLAGAACLIAMHANAQDNDAYDIAISAGPLQSALTSLSEQIELPILARSADLAELTVPQLEGKYSAEEALRKLLASSNLEFRKVGDGFAVVKSASAPRDSTKDIPAAKRPRDGTLRPPETDPAPLLNRPVIVTGYHSANSASLWDKRRARTIVDGLNQDTITMLPDLAVSDIARRIPGVSAIPEYGTATTRQIESRQSVVIRGLDANYIQTTIDDLPFATASEDNRAPNLSLVPPTAIRRVEALKVLTASDDPHGLTGRLNLKTASAFDFDEPRWAVRASLGKNSTSGNGLDDQGLNRRIDGLLTRTFGATDAIGLSAAASYERFYSTSFDERPGGQADTYLFYSPDPHEPTPVQYFTASNGYPAPGRNQLYLFESSQARGSGLLKLEYAPGSSTYFSLLGGAFWQEEEETRNEHLVVVDKDQRPLEQTASSGVWTNGTVESGYVYQPETTVTGLLAAHFNHQLSRQSSISIAGTVSRSDVDVTRNMSKFIRGATLGDTVRNDQFAYQVTASGVVLDFLEPDAINDPSTYTSSYVRARDQDIQQDLAHFTGRYRFEPDDHPIGLETGLSLTVQEREFDRTYFEGDVFDTTNCVAADIRDCPLATFSNFVEMTRFSTTDPDVDFLLVDDQTVRQAWLAQGMPLTVDRTANSLDTDYELFETLFGAYAKLTYQQGPVYAEAGVRYDLADAEIDLFLRDVRLDGETDSDQFVPATRASSYQDVLPSALIKIDATPDIQVRAAYSRTIGRPNVKDLTSKEEIGIPENGLVTIKRGNPDLTPLASDNFDLALDWYFDGGDSAISAAAFYKNVDDLIFLQTTRIDDYELDGENFSVSIVQPTNANSASLYGLELSATKDFSDMLPTPFDGLSLKGNLTWIGSELTFLDAQGDSRDTGGWVNQPEFIFNGQVAYESGPLGVNVAYNHVSEYLSNVLSDTGDLHDTYAQPRGVLDFQVRYDFNDHLTLIAEAENVTSEDIVFHRRFPFGDLLATRVERGRVLWLGFRLQN